MLYKFRVHFLRFGSEETEIVLVSANTPDEARKLAQKRVEPDKITVRKVKLDRERAPA